jgi:outer membrane protein insertion porin family
MQCDGTQTLKFGHYITPLPNTNYVVRMSTGLELQVILPMVNAPFRLYYAYNPLRVDTETTTPSLITRDMFPAGSAGAYSYAQTLASYAPSYQIREPRKTLRLTVSTTF